MLKTSDFSAIYGIRHMSSGRIYVGSATHLKARFRVHRNSLKKGTHHSRYLQAAWEKYGSDSFEFVVLEVVPEKSRLLERENEWITSLQSADPAHGFNMCKKAGSQLGMRHSSSAREKMSIAHSGRKKTPEHQQAINSALKGRKLSTACKQKLSVAHIGTRMSEASRAKMSESRKGKTASPEARAKISAAITARHAAARANGVTISGKPLMGYQLREQLYQATQPAHHPV